MVNPLTFGIELEMAVAMVLEIDKDLPHPDPHETRKTSFKCEEYEDLKMDRSRWLRCTEKEVMKQIAQTIAKAKFPIDVSDTSGEAKGDKWVVYTDSTISAPFDSKYSFAGVELKSPAYYYQSDALEAVEQMCKLLNDTFVINVNISCGFHVHVGNGRKGFPFHTIRSLATFLWVFEPQLDSLHPSTRVGGDWCGSMRHTAPHVIDQEMEMPPRKVTPYDGAIEIMKCADMYDLHSNFTDSRSVAYNFHNFDDHFGDCEDRNTIEFRQHEGTIDPVRILNWIKVCHGIVAYIQHLPPVQLFSIIELAQLEMWEKSFSEQENTELEKELGPILADGDFTVIDLLHLIGLPEQAKYYETKWKTHKLPEKYKTSPPDPPWDVDSSERNSTPDLSDGDTTKSLEVLKSLGGGHVEIPRSPSSESSHAEAKDGGSSKTQDSGKTLTASRKRAGSKSKYVFYSDSESDGSPEKKRLG